MQLDLVPYFQYRYISDNVTGGYIVHKCIWACKLENLTHAHAHQHKYTVRLSSIYFRCTDDLPLSPSPVETNTPHGATVCKGGSHGRDFQIDVGINHPDVLERREHHNICTVFPHMPGLKFNPADPFHRL